MKLQNIFFLNVSLHKRYGNPQAWRSGIYKTLPGETIFEHFKRLFNNGSKEQHVLLALICWSLWNRRNKWVWNRAAVSVFGTTSAVVSLLVSWKEALLERAISISTAAVFGMQRWQAPR